MTDPVLHWDKETRSVVDLRKAGLDNYSRHPTTDVLCAGYAFDDEPIDVLKIIYDKTCPPRVKKHVENGGIVVAHNAAFEYALWSDVMAKRYGWPPIAIEQLRCTMVMAYAMSLPGALEDAAPAVGVQHQKDMAGHRLMLMLCKPREIKPDGTIIWWELPEQIERLCKYCGSDVAPERDLWNRLMQLSPDEQRLWCLDSVINRRGVYVDRSAVTSAIAIAESESLRLNADMRRVTNGFVSKATEVARLKKWMVSRGITDAEDGLAKADVIEYLEDPATPPDVCDALRIRREAAKTSTAKLRPMLDAGSPDARLRMAFQFHGAGTGRWAGRRVQLHNLVRPKLKPAEVEDALAVIQALPPEQAIKRLALWYGPALDVMSWCLRGMLAAAPGNELLVADYSNIEGRGLAWLAGDERKLQKFREFDAGTGPDIYKATAADILGKPIDQINDEERQASGKVPELACGYGGGVGAFQTMAKTYGVKISDEDANDIKKRWRDAHPKIVQYWARPKNRPDLPRGLEEAAMDAVLNPGLVFSVGPPGRQVSYKKSGSFLWCELPSGRVLCYPYPKIMPVLTPWGEMKDSLTYMCVVDEQQRKKGKIIEDAMAHGDWQRVSTYGGKLSENCTQAICRDLLAAGMWNVENAGYPVVLHVHDEIGSEVPRGFGDLKEFERLCSQMPPWAAGLPVVAKGYRGTRYKKE